MSGDLIHEIMFLSTNLVYSAEIMEGLNDVMTQYRGGPSSEGREPEDLARDMSGDSLPHPGGRIMALQPFSRERRTLAGQ